MSTGFDLHYDEHSPADMTKVGDFELEKSFRKRKAARDISLYDSRWYFPSTWPAEYLNNLDALELNEADEDHKADDDDIDYSGLHLPNEDLKGEGNFDSRLLVGDNFDAIQFLFPAPDSYLIRRKEGNKEVKVYAQDLERKSYVIIFTFYIPVMTDGKVASICYQLLDIFSEIAKEHDDFEVVLVVRMRPDLPKHLLTEMTEDAFNHFFAPFSPLFLAVPITEDTCSRKLFEKSGSRCYSEPGCIVTDVKNKQALQVTLFSFQLFGADLYPFNRLNELWNQANNLCCGKMTLAAFLQCQSSDTDTDTDALTCVRPKCRCGIKESLSSLNNNKVVLLYSLCDGRFFDKLLNLYTHCKSEKEFELIVVRARSYLVTDPSMSSALAGKVDTLLENIGCCGWLHRSFDDRVIRRLSKLCDFQYVDKLVVVGPNTSYVDPDARLVVEEFGYKYFPFTKHTVWDEEVTRLRNLRLQKWLQECGIDKLVTTDGEDLPVSHLQDMNVVVYFGFVTSTDEVGDWDGQLAKWLDDMGATSEGKVRMIFVRLDEGSGAFDLGSMKRWTIFPELDEGNVKNNSLFRSLSGDFIMGTPVLAAFGPDGGLVRLGLGLEISLMTSTFPDEAEDALCTDVAILLNRQPRNFPDSDLIWC